MAVLLCLDHNVLTHRVFSLASRLWATEVRRATAKPVTKLSAVLRRNTYIMAAVHGGGYCSSAGLAVRTIMANALRVGAVDTIGDALVFLGKLSVMAGAGESLPLKMSECLWLMCYIIEYDVPEAQPGASSVRENSTQDTHYVSHACMSCKHCQHHALAASTSTASICCPDRHSMAIGAKSKA